MLHFGGGKKQQLFTECELFKKFTFPLSRECRSVCYDSFLNLEFDNNNNNQNKKPRILKFENPNMVFESNHAIQSNPIKIQDECFCDFWCLLEWNR